jgi:hypothetical protein
VSSTVAAGKRRLVLRAVGGGALLLIAAAFCWAVLREPPEPPEPSFAEGQKRYIVPQAPLVEAPIKPLAEVKDRLAPADLVLGVAVGEEARAYPINMLTFEPRRKVLNDTLGGQPVVVTWCDACHSGIVYSREVDGQTLVFAVDGRLWKDSLVMHDEATRSLWSQLQGKAQHGKWAGTHLRPLPSVVTDWQTWVRTHPASTVAWFKGSEREFTTAMYQDAGRFVLGIAEGQRARAWTFADLARRGAVNDTWEGRPVVAVLEPSSKTARVYDRQVGGRTLTFRLDGAGLVDQETGTAWEPTTGEAVSGPLAGQRLSPLAAVVAFRDAWLGFHPRSVR